MLTKLEIINDMLAATGTAPLTGNDVLHPFYTKANNKLDLVSGAVQARGWWFNRATRTLKQTTAGEIVLPATLLHADPVDAALPYVKRGNRLYNKQTGSYFIGHEVLADIIEHVPVDELPPHAADYTRARAVYEFYRDEEGDGNKLASYREERDRAWVELRGEHLRNADVNYFNSYSHAQLARPGRRGLPR